MSTQPSLNFTIQQIIKILSIKILTSTRDIEESMKFIFEKFPVNTKHS